MTPAQGMAEFFAMEAGEYLERLDALVSGATAPDPDEFVRLARALRGSALMANQQPIAGAAGGLDPLARALKESRLAWDPGNRQMGIRAVDDLKILVRALPRWTPAEDAKALALTQELERIAGARAPRRSGVRAADTGTRALIAREGAALASELDRIAVALAQSPTAVDQATAALKVMQPLRGVAGLGDFPPLPDVLEGIERAVGEVVRRKDATSAAPLFRAAARALARAAQEAAGGPVAADTPELAEFAGHLRQLLEPAGAAVPIESLYYDDAGPHVVQPGSAAPRPGSVGRVELVSHGEHLKLVSDGLQAATSPAQRDLRAQTLTPTLRSLQAAGGAVAAFAAAAHEAVTRAASLPDPSALVTALRDAGTLLAHATAPDDAGLGEALTRIARSLQSQAATAPRSPTRAVSAPAPTPAPPAPAPAPPSVPAPAAAAPSAPPAPAPAARTSGAGRAAPVTETPDIAGSFMRYARYLATFGPGAPSITELIAGPPGLQPPAGPPGGQATVSLADLSYGGPAALERAIALQDDIRAAMKPGGNTARLPELLEEVFDLVKLGLQHGN